MHLGSPLGWRVISKLPWLPSSRRFGMYLPSSHAGGASTSPNNHPALNQLVSKVNDACGRSKVEGYDEETGKGCLRYAQFSVDRPTSTVAVTLVVNGSGSDVEALAREIARDPVCHSVWIHTNEKWKHSNAVFDVEGDWKHVHGPRHVADDFGGKGVELRFPPNVFRQANPEAFSNIVDAVKAEARGKCLELYGGVGTIGLNVLEGVDSLVCSDSNPNNVPAFEGALKTLNKRLRKKATYVGLDAEGMVEAGWLKKDFDTVIVDPPRKGCGRAVLEAVNASKAGRLVYVSCGFDAFVRDKETLEEGGGWVVEKVEGHVLFPGADAIETLAVFKRGED